MTQSRILISLLGVAADVGTTVVSGYYAVDLGFGLCGGDGGAGNVPRASAAGRFCDSRRFSAYLLGQFAIPIACVAAGSVWAVVRDKALGIGVGILTAVALLIAAASHLDSLSVECDYPVQNSEQCDTN
jgi:hypothetical protein